MSGALLLAAWSAHFGALCIYGTMRDEGTLPRRDELLGVISWLFTIAVGIYLFSRYYSGVLFA